MSASLSVLELLRRHELWAAPHLPFLLAESARSQLAKYIEMLLAWNRALNLCAHHNPLGLLRDLIQDSFFLAQFLDSLLAQTQKPQIYDIGAGAGIPGIPLRISWRHGNYVMLESRQKRAIFLTTALAQLKLPRTVAICVRAERYLPSGQPAHCIVSRAFMPWPKLLHFCKPCLAGDGIVVIMANEPPPILHPSLEECWKLKASLEYCANNKPRWLWAMKSND